MKWYYVFPISIGHQAGHLNQSQREKDNKYKHNIHFIVINPFLAFYIKCLQLPMCLKYNNNIYIRYNVFE